MRNWIGFDSSKPHWFAQVLAMQAREATPQATISSLRGSLIYYALKATGVTSMNTLPAETPLPEVLNEC